MTADLKGILIGGLIPALFFGIGTTLQRASNKEGLATSFYLALLGLGFLLVASFLFFIEKERLFSYRALGFSVINGIFWGSAYALMMYALTNYRVEMSKLIPIVNANTLVAVVLCLCLFAEWQDLNVIKLIFGAILVIVGASIVSLS